MTGSEIRAARERLGLSRRQLAAALAYADPRTLARIEQGRRDPPFLLALVMRLAEAGRPETLAVLSGDEEGDA